MYCASIRGASTTIFAMCYDQKPEPGREFGITLHEDSWIQISNKPLTRELMMMVLAEVKSFSIRSNINLDTTQVGIKNINYGKAVEPSKTLNPLPTVEKCNCPKGYTGTSLVTIQ